MKAVSAGLVLAVMIGLFVAGCEVANTPDTAITVTPGSVVLSGETNTQVFVASAAGTNAELALPLVWTVDDSSVGIIKSSAGMSAVYESTGVIGNNSVRVRDQGESEGVAIVSQL